LTYRPNGELFVKHAIWRFTPNRWLGKIRIEVFGQNGTVVFRGLVGSTEESYRFILEGPQNETACFRIKKVFPDQNETYGLWLGVDFRGKITASGRYLSRKPVTEEEFSRLMIQCYQKHARYPVISATEECQSSNDQEPPHMHVEEGKMGSGLEEGKMGSRKARWGQVSHRSIRMNAR